MFSSIWVDFQWYEWISLQTCFLRWEAWKPVVSEGRGWFWFSLEECWKDSSHGHDTLQNLVLTFLSELNSSNSFILLWWWTIQSEYGLWTDTSRSAPWGLVRNAHSQVPSQAYWSRTSGGGAQAFVFSGVPKWLWGQLEFENFRFRFLVLTDPCIWWVINNICWIKLIINTWCFFPHLPGRC